MQGTVRYTTYAERAAEVGDNSPSDGQLVLLYLDASQSFSTPAYGSEAAVTTDVVAINNADAVGLADGAHVCVAASPSDVSYIPRRAAGSKLFSASANV